MFRYQLKLLPFWNLLLCAALLILLPLVVSFRFLEFQQIGTIGETVAPLLGILLLTPLAFLEDLDGQREALAVRPTPYWCGFMMRVALVTLLLALGIAALLSVAAAYALPFSFGAMFVGLLASAALYGGIGLLTGHLSKSRTLAYLLPMFLFSLEFFTRGKYTGRFFSLSLMEGVLRPEKWALLAAGAALLTANVILSKRQVQVGR